MTRHPDYRGAPRGAGEWFGLKLFGLGLVLYGLAVVLLGLALGCSSRGPSDPGASPPPAPAFYYRATFNGELASGSPSAEWRALDSGGRALLVTGENLDAGWQVLVALCRQPLGEPIPPSSCSGEWPTFQAALIRWQGVQVEGGPVSGHAVLTALSPDLVAGRLELAAPYPVPGGRLELIADFRSPIRQGGQ